MSAVAMLRWKIVERSNGELEAQLEGEITDHVTFDHLIQERRARVVLDLDGVRRMNSHGVRRFVDFLRETQAQGGLIVAENCRPAIVYQMGMIPEIGDRLEVRSLYVPYECPNCFEETELLVELPSPRAHPPLPSPRCRCGATMDVAEPVERYFAFLAGR